MCAVEEEFKERGRLYYFQGFLSSFNVFSHPFPIFNPLQPTTTTPTTPTTTTTSLHLMGKRKVIMERELSRARAVCAGVDKGIIMTERLKVLD